MANKSDIIKFIKFAITGVLNTVVDFGIFTLLTSFLSVGIYTAQIISYSSGIANSYVINKSWTFSSKKRFLSVQLLKFLLVNIFLLGISLVIIYLGNDILGFHKLVAKLFSTVVTVVLGFVINRLFVFND